MKTSTWIAGALIVVVAAFSALSYSRLRAVFASNVGAYEIHRDGRSMLRSREITRPNALANCQRNASINPGQSIRCTWNGIEIFNNEVPAAGATPTPLQPPQRPN